MKYSVLLLLFLCLGGFFISGSLYGQSALDGGKQNKGVFIEVSKGGNVYLDLAGSSLPKGVTQFGYYLMDKKGNAISGAALDLTTLAENNGLIGNFDKGSNIGFWMKTEEGTYLDSYFHNGEKGDERNAAYTGNNSGSGISFIMGFGGYGSGYSPYKGDGTENDMILTVTNQQVQQNRPSGQPLPGVLLATVIGGSVYGAIRLKRSRRNKGKTEVSNDEAEER